MLKDLKEGDEVTFSRYGKSMSGTITAINHKTGSVVVDKIHYIKLFQIIKIRHV